MSPLRLAVVIAVSCVACAGSPAAIEDEDESAPEPETTPPSRDAAVVNRTDAANGPPLDGRGAGEADQAGPDVGTGGDPGAADAATDGTKTADASAAGADSASDPTATTDAQSPPRATAGGPFDCTLVIGISATGEWYRAGFEDLVDNARWELIQVHSGFVTLWADPKSAVWSSKPTSACAKNAGSPDRIVFVALEFSFNTLDQWLPPLRAVVKNLQARYPGVRSIELATFVRAPGNKPCPQREPPRSTISAAQDAANLTVAQEHRGLVTVAPRFEADSCTQFTQSPPHATAAGATAWAKRIAAHYGR